MRVDDVRTQRAEGAPEPCVEARVEAGASDHVVDRERAELAPEGAAGRQRDDVHVVPALVECLRHPEHEPLLSADVEREHDLHDLHAR